MRYLRLITFLMVATLIAAACSGGGGLEPRDTRPDPFQFQSRSGVEPSSIQTSNTITVSGINAPASISLTNGSLILDGAPSDAGTVNEGQTVAVRLQASASFGTTVSSQVNIGGESATFSVTTRGQDDEPEEDTTPDPFHFTSVTEAEPSTMITSAPVIIQGINALTPISTTAGDLVIDGVLSSAVEVANGQSVAVRLESSPSYSASTAATVTVGGVSATFTVTTKPQPPTVVVTNLNDSGPGSLRQAINEATDGMLVSFDPSLTGTIMLLSQVLIANDINVRGPGPEALTLNGNDANRLLVVGSGALATVSGITFANGYIAGTVDNAGGAILVQEDAYLNLTNAVITNSVASDVGGGVLNLGTMVLNNVRLASNTADEGGAIWNTGVMELIDSTVQANTSLGRSRQGDGAGIKNLGSLTLLRTSVIANIAAQDAGGIDNYNTNSELVIDSSTISGNIANGNGAGIRSWRGQLKILNSVISDNTIPAAARASGGGMHVEQGAIEVRGSTINSNVALSNNTWQGGSGGGIYLYNVPAIIRTSQIAFNTATHDGGGLYSNSSATLIDSSLVGNTADFGGGLFSDRYNGEYLIQASLVADNRALTDGGGVHGYKDGTVLNSTFVGNQANRNGGAVFNTQNLFVSYSTITGNTANNLGDGVHTQSLMLRASIVAGNDQDIAGLGAAVTTLGHNLVGNGTDTGLIDGSSSDIVGSAAAPVNPMLGVRADNGGPTETVAPLAGSRAIAHIPIANCAVAADQRGEPRPGADGRCDIGAFEVQ